MRTVSSYGVELRKQNIPIRQTLDIYRSAVSCLIEIYAQTWDELAVITEPKKRFNTAEHLVHTTKKNQARFDFDLRFPKMPSYLISPTAACLKASASVVVWNDATAVFTFRRAMG